MTMRTPLQHATDMAVLAAAMYAHACVVRAAMPHPDFCRHRMCTAHVLEDHLELTHDFLSDLREGELAEATTPALVGAA